MDDADRYRLLFGPYAAPALRRGDRADCEHRGETVTVGGLTDAPIPWPRVLKTGRPSLIVCGDLARAVRLESVLAISRHWGVNPVTVWAWRKSLGVGRVTPGTSRLHRDYAPAKILTPESRAASDATNRTSEAKAKQSARSKGRSMPPQTRAALMAAVKRPKSKAHRRRIAFALRFRAIRLAYEGGETITSLAKRYGLTYVSIHEIVRGRRGNRPAVYRNDRRKLDREKVRAIRADRDASGADLARKYDVSESTITRIRQGRWWRQVP